MARPRVRVRCQDRKIIEMLFKCFFFARDTHGAADRIMYELHYIDANRRKGQNGEYRTCITSLEPKAPRTRFADRQLGVRRR